MNEDLDLTLVIISHDLDVISNEATELACINQNLVYHGPPKEFFQKDYFERLYGKGVKFILHGH
jgi:zinc transport system ATP-binding protein